MKFLILFLLGFSVPALAFFQPQQQQPSSTQTVSSLSVLEYIGQEFSKAFKKINEDALKKIEKGKDPKMALKSMKDIQSRMWKDFSPQAIRVIQGPATKTVKPMSPSQIIQKAKANSQQLQELWKKVVESFLGAEVAKKASFQKRNPKWWPTFQRRVAGTRPQGGKSTHTGGDGQASPGDLLKADKKTFKDHLKGFGNNFLGFFKRDVIWVPTAVLGGTGLIILITGVVVDRQKKALGEADGEADGEGEEEDLMALLEGKEEEKPTSKGSGKSTSSPTQKDDKKPDPELRQE
jgi:hypothetical protein